MIKRITLTKEHLKLIPFFYEQEEGDNKIVFDKTHLYNLGSHLLEDLAMILGYNDSAINGTEEDLMEKHSLTKLRLICWRCITIL